MKRLVYIAFLFSLVLPGSFSGQQFCTYQVKALDAYQNSEYLVAEKYLDSAFVNCNQIVDDAYSWHIKGFIEKEIYQKVENKDYNYTNICEECSNVFIERFENDDPEFEVNTDLYYAKTEVYE